MEQELTAEMRAGGTAVATALERFGDELRAAVPVGANDINELSNSIDSDLERSRRLFAGAWSASREEAAAALAIVTLVALVGSPASHSRVPVAARATAAAVVTAAAAAVAMPARSSS